MKNYSFNSKINNLKYHCLYFIKQNKLKIFIFIFIFVFALITGIFTITKYLEMGSLSKDYLLFDYVDSDFDKFSSLFNRFLSGSFVLIVISLCSLSSVLIPISLMVWIYRAYLIGYNCTILIICYGFNGILTALIVILPCQLLFSLLFLIFFCISIEKLRCRKNKTCSCSNVNMFKILIIFLILLFIISSVEFLLLLLFNANVILVI